MIPRSRPSWQTCNWQNELAKAIRDPDLLLQRLNLSRNQLPAALQAARLFNLRVTESYLSRIKPGDPGDPLLLQILPRGEELEDISGFINDPVGDLDAMAAPGLIHKYHGRCLLVVTGACAVHCRYCFRRHYPYQEASTDQAALQQALDYIRNDASLSEVILSGGDPLSLSDQRLASLVKELEAIPHIQRLRIHTRQPVVLPSRITADLCETLSNTGLQTVMVLHFNHGNEINNEIIEAMGHLKQRNITLLNQSVLLNGINDSPEALIHLSNRLFEAGILPYYLHMLDRVAGAAHFEVEPDQARIIHKELQKRLPGYLVPRLVVEKAGHPYKIPVQSSPD